MSGLEPDPLHPSTHTHRTGCHGGTSRFSSGTFLRKTCLNLAAAVFGITGGTGLPSSSFITCWVSSTGLPSCLDPSAELVGVRVTRWEHHYPDLILSNLRHLRHASSSQPCFQFKGILDELALSYCCHTDNAKRN